MGNLTFSQTYGYEGLPQQLKLEELPPEARTQIWNVFFAFMVESTFANEETPAYVVDEWERILKSIHLFHESLPLEGVSKACHEGARRRIMR